MSEFTKKKYILPLLFSITNSAVTMDSDGAQNCDFRAVVTAVEVRGECDRARRSFGDSGDAGVRFRPRVGLRVGDLVPAESGSALCELTRTEDDNPELGASWLHELN